MLGDTAQTITQGVGFKFKNLNKVFYEINKNANAWYTQLTVNFRSHNQILDLANSLVCAIELIFPSTIDPLEKERSHWDGMKPVLF